METVQEQQIMFGMVHMMQSFLLYADWTLKNN